MDLNKTSEIIIYRTPKGKVSVDVIFSDETFWLTQKAMAELFGVEVPAVSKHLNNIYDSGELSSEATISKMETVVNRDFKGAKKDNTFFKYKKLHFARRKYTAY